MTAGRRLVWTGVVVAGLIGSSAVLVLLSAAFKSLGSTRLYAALAGVFLLAGLGAYILTVRVILPFWTGSTIRKNSIVVFSITAGGAFALFALPVLPTHDVLIPQRELRIEVTGEKNPASAGEEVTLLWFVTHYGEVSYASFDPMGAWQRSGGSLTAPVGEHASLTWRGATGNSTTLVFKTGPNAGVVTVAWDGQAERIDLYEPEVGEHTYVQDMGVTVFDKALFLSALATILAFIMLVAMIHLTSLPTGIERLGSAPFWSRLLLAMVSVALLYLNFFSNRFGIAETAWFTHFDRYSEGLILGRLVQSRQAGLLSAGGLTGYGVPQPGDSREYVVSYQYDSYFEGSTFGSYVLYRSQSGGQGIIFSLLDELLPIAAREKFDLFQGLVALSTAVALGAIVFWFAGEFGIVTGVIVLAGMLISQWLVVFARNLWWPLWVFYLPMLALTAYLGRRRCMNAPPQFWIIGSIVLVTVLLKALLSGYAYMPTVLIMMVVPLLYTSLAESWQVRKTTSAMGSAVLFSLLALLISFAILGAQLAAAEGGSFNFAGYLVDTLRERTIGSGRTATTEVQACLDSNILSVVGLYLNATFFDINNFITIQNAQVAERLLKVSYGFLMLCFMFCSGALMFLAEAAGGRQSQRKVLALIVSTWFSLLAPLSWLIIFKEHSCVHPHLNVIVWQMPFTLFGFAIVGVLLSVATAGWRSRRASKGQENDAQAHHPNEK